MGVKAPLTKAIGAACHLSHEIPVKNSVQAKFGHPHIWYIELFQS